MVERRNEVSDPLLGIIKPWEQHDYTSTVWDERAYTKMFEKFFYAEPCKIKDNYPQEWKFATDVVFREYSYMQNTYVYTPRHTEKNIESSPAFPKFLKYDTEEAYLLENGWSEYDWLWDNFEGKRVLWWTFLKNEVLKKKKVEDNDIRMIMCTDPGFTRFGACFEQHQNRLMKERSETHHAQIGWTPFFGGLDKRLTRLQKKGDTFVELDWTRFDGTIPREVFKHIKEIRWFFLHHKCKTPENRKRYEWYVSNLLDKITLLPTGEVTLIQTGNPSGQISTTTDNNMVNTFLTAFEVCYNYKKQYGRVPTVQEYYDHVDTICYGDDRILAYDSSWLNYKVEDVPSMYKDIFGMWVKPENIKSSHTLEGLSFCGLVFIHRDKWYGIPNVDKILSTLEHPVRRLPNIEALWGKLVSLRILCEWAPQEVHDYLDEQFVRIREYAQSENLELPEVPSDFYTIVWTGGPK
nr:MAG: nonstructural protein [Avian astrovirus 3]